MPCGAASGFSLSAACAVAATVSAVLSTLATALREKNAAVASMNCSRSHAMLGKSSSSSFDRSRSGMLSACGGAKAANTPSYVARAAAPVSPLRLSLHALSASAQPKETTGASRNVPAKSRGSGFSSSLAAYRNKALALNTAPRRRSRPPRASASRSSHVTHAKATARHAGNGRYATPKGNRAPESDKPARHKAAHATYRVQSAVATTPMIRATGALRVLLSFSVPSTCSATSSRSRPTTTPATSATTAGWNAEASTA